MQAKTKTYNYLQVTGLADTHDEPQAEEENEVLQQESYEEAEIVSHSWLTEQAQLLSLHGFLHGGFTKRRNI